MLHPVSGPNARAFFFSMYNNAPAGETLICQIRPFPAAPRGAAEATCRAEASMLSCR